MLASTKEARAMMTNLIFLGLFILFMLGAVAATLSTMMHFHGYAIFSLLSMGACAYGMHVINTKIY